MKKYTLVILMLISTFSIKAQKLNLNENGLYSYTESVERTTDINDIEDLLYGLGYSEIKASRNKIYGIGRTAIKTSMALIEVEYMVKITINKDGYDVVIYRFLLKDKQGKTPLEEIRTFRRKWVKSLNKKVPGIVDNLQ